MDPSFPSGQLPTHPLHHHRHHHTPLCHHHHHNLHQICSHHYHHHHHHHHHYFCHFHLHTHAHSQNPQSVTLHYPFEESLNIVNNQEPSESNSQKVIHVEPQDLEEEDEEPVFVLTDEWREFFAKSEAKRRLEKQQAKKKARK